TAGVYDVNLRVASLGSGGVLRLRLEGPTTALRDDVVLGDDVAFGPTGGWQNWETASMDSVVLPAGEHILKVIVVSGGFNLNRMEFVEAVSTVGSKDAGDVPQPVRIMGPYPNPFEGSMTVAFETDVPTSATASVYDVLGRELYTTPSRNYATGRHQLDIKPDLAAGVYLLRLTFDDSPQVRVVDRMIVAM
ncbi:MAG: T9SS type A sorting domain-containing protein, partial [Rhodothermia bacterium]|nr:T9SS type A sorting domain-containing protein [Rhodothermia bacterium]